MTSRSARRLAACLASATALVAFAAPGTALAKKGPETDRGEQCSGENIVGRGSTFQNAAQLNWAPQFNVFGGKYACDGAQGSKGTPKAEYRNTEKADRGSGSCIRAFGAEKTEPNRTYSFCGTDEAPNAKQKEEMESWKAGGGSESLLTVPVLQGAESVIIHLPEGCLAKAEGVSVNGKTMTIGRLVLENATVAGIYEGTINTWAQVLAAEPKDKITCANESELNDEITRVVRLDSSGTTHIFKAYLSLVDTGKIKMEAFPEEIGGTKTGCGEALPEAEESWAEVAAGCQNQRWPAAAKVVRNTEAGNPGVINKVNSTPSSIGYADMAVAREYKFFSEAAAGGGEEKLGKGEQHAKFWAVLQNGATPQTTYMDPSTKGDGSTSSQSNCKNTRYIENGEKEFPPASIRALWNEAKAATVEEHYPLCGLTYDLAFREYKPYGFTKGVATSVHDYLKFEVSSSNGGKIMKKKDYEALPKAVIKEAEAGLDEIGWEKA